MRVQRIRQLLFLGWVLLLPTSCSMDTPSAPPRDNPLDIHNPQTAGNPFALQVERTDDGMRLRWTRVTGPVIAGYGVYRRVDGGEFTLLQWVDEATTGLVDTSVEQGHQYEYYVAATVGAMETPAGTQHELVHVPAGEFMMGSEDGGSNERPVHRVYLDGFNIDKYEVTNGQWNGYARSVGQPVKSEPDDHPVVSVSWYDARDYCVWAGLRLPTEAEWEKAARGGLEGRAYPWGDELTRDQANYSGTGGRDQWDRTAPVGSFDPNGYGLYDLSGNVWEWVSDWYDSGYYANSPSSNPTGPSSGSPRVLRGGSWISSPHYLRSGNRLGYNPSSTLDFLGFRCAQDE